MDPLFRNCAGQQGLITSPYRLLVPLFVSIALLLGLWTATARANGWEHFAVPYTALLEALSFDDPGTRTKAAESLAVRGDLSGTEAILDALARPEPDPDVRQSFYNALGRLGHLESLEVLTTCFDEEDRDELQSTCARALGGIGSDPAVETLGGLVNADISIRVRAGAIDGLGLAGSDLAVEVLEDALLSGQGGASLRPRLIASLGRTQNERAAEPLLKALKDANSPRQQAPIIRALAGVASPRSVPALSAILETTVDPGLRILTTIALVTSGEGAVAPALTSLLDDPQPAVQFAAARGLQNLKDETTGPALLAFANNTYTEINTLLETGGAANAAEIIGLASLLEPVLQGLADFYAPATTTLFIDLAGLETARDATANPLSPALSNALYQMRRIAVFGLGYTDSEDAFAVLTGNQGAGSRDKRLRALSARSLGVLEHEGSVTALIQLLEDEAAEVRWAAADALGRLPSSGQIAPLIGRLSDRDGRVRTLSAGALGLLGAEDAVVALNEIAANDTSESARKAAALALEQIRRN